MKTVEGPICANGSAANLGKSGAHSMPNSWQLAIRDQFICSTFDACLVGAIVFRKMATPYTILVAQPNPAPVVNESENNTNVYTPTSALPSRSNRDPFNEDDFC